MASHTTTGRACGNFVVEREIGRGGMGVVLLARQRSLDRPVVLKKLRRDLAESPELLERFRREARAAAALHHQNVVAVYDCFTWRGDHYIAQEYVDGTDLKSALARAGPLPWRIAALIGLEVARGLEEIHAGGTVHRDLKPANILLGRRGETKIADFGIALGATGESLTQPGVVVGSPLYMPPEQLLGERVDARGDLFSLGVVLYESVTGAPPYPAADEGEGSGKTLVARMRAERYERLRRRAPDVPRFLSRAVRSCLRGRARQRAGSARALRRALERSLGSPSPADARAEIAQWLWERQVFERRPHETLVQVAAADAPPGPRAPRWAVAALALAAALATLLCVDVRGAPDSAASEAARFRLDASPAPAPHAPGPDERRAPPYAPSRVR